ncbi:MAG: T9SS type A sorting domain-containing protein [Bacteroidetes bacterium]|nr:T9SS type A sorting domain-containing protein [Bacteroidota bacterium]
MPTLRKIKRAASRHTSRQLFGDPLTPFIWTRTGGIRELNEYIHNVLGDSTNTHQVYTADCISPDGHYIAGYGVDNSASIYFVYRVSLVATPSSTQDITGISTVKVYPNPTSNLITIETPGKTVLTISSMDGKVVYKNEINGKQIIDMTTYAAGIYFLTLQSDNAIQTQKIIKG